MSDRAITPKPDDTWSARELFARAVAEATSDEDPVQIEEPLDPDDAYWAVVRLLQRRPPVDVWALVTPLAESKDSRLRSLVPDVLRFLGGRPQPLLDQTIGLLRHMLSIEKSPMVIGSIASAFVDLGHPAAVELLLPFVHHREAEVRTSVVCGLLPVAQLVVPQLIELSRDSEGQVRNWATFGLGSQLGLAHPECVDSPEIRQALADRLSDPHDETRAEAVLGLACRRDPRVLPILEHELATTPPWTHYYEAAEFLGEPRLYPLLVRLRDAGEKSTDLEAALEACRPPQLP